MVVFGVDTARRTDGVAAVVPRTLIPVSSPTPRAESGPAARVEVSNTGRRASQLGRAIDGAIADPDRRQRASGGLQATVRALAPRDRRTLDNLLGSLTTQLQGERAPAAENFLATAGTLAQRGGDVGAFARTFAGIEDSTSREAFVAATADVAGESDGKATENAPRFEDTAYLSGALPDSRQSLTNRAVRQYFNDPSGRDPEVARQLRQDLAEAAEDRERAQRAQREQDQPAPSRRLPL